MATVIPYIPQFITVHLGPPSSNAENVTVSFSDYIKNVASSEIYPTWDESAITANIYAQISYALNRVYTEFYNEYDFDITNSTAYDQKFINGRNFFENIERIVDDIFTSYIRRMGFIEPLAAKYCNGTTVTCEGLSQWGSENLAQQGYNSIEILRYYYGNNIELVQNAPIREIESSYPGTPVRRGSVGNDVVIIQTELNRISENYPAIGKINPVDGIFGENTENAVIRFQRIFNLAPDGIVGRATWNKLVSLYVGILRLAELESEGQQLFGASLEYPDAISEGDTGEKVRVLQYFLSVLSDFYVDIPFITIDGIFGQQTKNAVIAFQRANNLPETGVVGDETWDVMYNQYQGVVTTTLLNNRPHTVTTEPYPNEVLRLGSTGTSVTTLQQYLDTISTVFKKINPVMVTGIFGQPTREAVIAFQRQFGLPATGRVNEDTWYMIQGVYTDALSATNPSPMQYPGQPLTLGTTDQPRNS